MLIISIQPSVPWLTLPDLFEVRGKHLFFSSPQVLLLFVMIILQNDICQILFALISSSHQGPRT